MKNHLLIVLFAALLATSCDGLDPAKMQAEKLDTMDLSVAERAIADAMIEGYKKEMGTSLLRSRDVMRAGCYAKKVDMPSRFDRVHRLYIADYTMIDKDFYPWFKAKGISDQDAWDISRRFQKGYDASAIGALIKEMLKK